MTEEIFLDRPEATERLGRALSAVLAPGDTLLLSGPIGAGKTLLARAFIQSALQAAGRPVEDVPSPTYTLVQSYDLGDVEILHSDLYRLSDPTEVEELGLSDFMGHAICLIEWPDRLGELEPKNALHLDLSVRGGESAGRYARVWTASESPLPDRLKAALASVLEACK